MTPLHPEPTDSGASETGPADPAGVARHRVTAEPGGEAEWDPERMRRAKPREIRLGPDGTRRETEVADLPPTPAEPPV